MRRLLALSIGIAVVARVVWCYGAPAHAGHSYVTLNAAYDEALRGAEPVKIEQALALQADEKVAQAKGAILPKISLSAGYLRQDVPEDGANGSSVSKAFTKPDQTNAKLTLSQPLFQGLREFAAWRATQARYRAQHESLNQVKLLLYRDVSKAFFEVLSSERDEQNVSTLLSLTEQRVSELKPRVAIGKSRKGELLSAQSQMASSSAALEGARLKIKQARETLSLATGLARGSSLRDTDSSFKALDGIDAYISKLETRPDIKASREQVTFSEETVAVASGAHLPTLEIAGNYYFKRTGVLENSKWDVGLTLSLPVFQGGIIQSQVREARQKQDEQEAKLTQAIRAAEREIRLAYESYASALKQRAMLASSLAVAETNYEEQKRDYRLGLVSNLEVLQSLNSFIENKRSFDRVTYEAKAALCALEAATGEVPPREVPAGEATQ